jgi:hypothetical protein
MIECLHTINTILDIAITIFSGVFTVIFVYIMRNRH